MDYFLENITLRGWLLDVLPKLARTRYNSDSNRTLCHVFDGSFAMFLLARVSARLIGFRVRRLEFDFDDVRDESGMPIHIRTIFQDLAQFQKYACDDPVLRDYLNSEVCTQRQPTFLTKSLIDGLFQFDGNAWRAIALIQVCVWAARNDEASESPVLFLETQPWFNAIVQYASGYGVSAIPIRRRLNGRAKLRRSVRRTGRDVLTFVRRAKGLWKKSAVTDGLEFQTEGGRLGPLVAVQHYGQLNLNQPERHSDFLFWQCSSLQSRDVLATFSISRDPVDNEKWAELRDNGMNAVALTPGATQIHEIPVFHYQDKVRRVALAKSAGPNYKWIASRIRDYDRLHDYWTQFFSSYNVKVFVSWYKYDGMHAPISDALESLGGVTAYYQRSYEIHPSAVTTVNLDVFFGYSRSVAEIERRSGSTIRYHVSTGYLGDYRFQLLRRRAKLVKQSMRLRGAERILAYFDENWSEVPPWEIGKEVGISDHAFLLEKVISDPGFGLLLKPKHPASLRARLSVLGTLLEHAEATGRCLVYGDGRISSSHTPAESALASDVAVHGSLTAATAGIESALAGVPTLLLDRDHWPTSSLHELGVGQVLFKNIGHMWDSCQEHWSSPGSVPGFGDWSSCLDEIDPFQDGHAAQRMGEYVNWLLQGFKDGLDRETVMANAAERYCAEWGSDKVVSIQGDLLDATPVAAENQEGSTSA